METLQKLPESKPPAPDVKPSASKHIEPGLVATGGALFAAGLGLGVAGAIAGAILGLLVGKSAQKEADRKDGDDS